MRGFLTALGLLCAALLARPALAQTNFTGGCPSSAFTVSNGGLTITATSVCGGGCEANTIKYGKWYYTVTPNPVGWTGGYGIGAPGWSTSSVANSILICDDPNSAGYQINAARNPANVISFGTNRLDSSATGVAYTPGKTIAVVINMDTDPNQFWITPDVTDTTGCGGGPVWNGSNTSSPVPARVATAHYPCGGPGTGGDPFKGPTSGETGLAYYTAGTKPVMVGQNYVGATNVTFDFGANATLDALIGSGGAGPTYRNWNVDGGDGGNPGPNHPQTRNVSNAPAWQQSTSYPSFGYRMLAGPAWIPSSSFTTTTYHAFGDSITQGAGASNPATNAYVSLIAIDKGLTLTDYGTGGAVASYVNGSEIFPNENPAASGNPLYTIMIGTNDSANGIGPYEAVYINNLESAVSWLGSPSTSKVSASACTLSGSWSAAGSLPSGSRATTTIGASATCAITVNNGVLYAWYKSNGFNYSIDGGSTTPATIYDYAGGTVSLLRFTGLSSGSHTLVITDTSGTTSLVGIGTPPTSWNCCRVLLSGVIRHQNGANDGDTAAYNADALTAYQAMAADGINTTFIPVRQYLDTTTDMNDYWHPNTLGHALLATAFEARLF